MNNVLDSLLELVNIVALWLEDRFSVKKKTEQLSSKKNFHNKKLRNSDMKPDEKK